jgi:hypothetical protein
VIEGCPLTGGNVLNCGPMLKTSASQHFVRAWGCCERDMLAVSLSAFHPKRKSRA